MHCILCQLPSASQQHLTAVQFYMQTLAISLLRMYCNYRHTSPWFAAFAMRISSLNSPCMVHNALPSWNWVGQLAYMLQW